MGEAQAAARHQQHVEELCAAALRALAGEADLHFRGQRLHRGRRRLPLYAPHLHPSLQDDDFASFRGAADGLALRVSRSDAALHRALVELQAEPLDAIARNLFDMFEQFRVESQVDERWPGARHNLRHRFEQWSAAFVRSGLTDTALGLLAFTVAQSCRSRLTGDAPQEQLEDLMEATRAGIAPHIGHALAGMRRTRADQAAFAVHAIALARWTARQLRLAGQGVSQGSSDDDREVDERLVFGLRMEIEPVDDAGDRDVGAALEQGSGRVIETASDYLVFTNAYDVELRAATLVRAAQLDDLRAQLDRRVAGQGLNIPRLARELHALLAAPRRDAWADAQEEGLIDGRRLAQLVASPTERRLFRQELREPAADAVVTFLIDCSGSMRAHVESVAALIDAFARALELAGMRSEILGFTTGAWNGGRARRDWLRAGQPPRPGRLNETLHLVFKDADTPWRRARRDIAAVLKGDVFREGIDGEALSWAARRLRVREEHRRLLIVVSDGCPMDTATQLANGPQLLDGHLQQVAAAIEAEGAIELFAVGVGLDLSPYYARSQVIDLDAGLGNRIFAEIVAMIAGRARR